MRHEHIKAISIAAILFFSGIAIGIVFVGCDGCTLAKQNRFYIQLGVSIALVAINAVGLVVMEYKKKKEPII